MRSVWGIPTKGFKGNHFAAFPPALVERCVQAGCQPGGVVLDPFAGSGTVLEYCRQNGIEAIGIELNPEYGRMAEERAMLNIPRVDQWGSEQS